MHHVQHIDCAELYTIRPDRFIELRRTADTWNAAVVEMANLLSDLQDAVAMESLNLPDTIPTIIWHQRPTLHAEHDLATGAAKYVTRCALTTVPEIDYIKLAQKQPPEEEAANA